MKPLSTLTALFAATAALSHNILLVGAAGKDSETVTIGDRVFELSTDANITAGRILVDLSASSAAAATGTLTTTGNAVADETVTIGARVYTFKAASTAANQVTVGANAAESLDNLVAAITGAAGAGTKYGTGTAVHADVTAVRASATMVVTAKVKGTAGNAIASTETMTNASWGGSVLASGADATATQTRDALVTAINLTGQTEKWTATAITGGLLFIDQSGRGVRACSETLAGSGNNWVAANSFGADYGGAVPNLTALVQRSVTAAEATAGRFVVALPATPIGFTVEIRTAGAKKAWDGVATIVGNAILLDNSGSTDFAENDVVAVVFAV